MEATSQSVKQEGPMDPRNYLKLDTTSELEIRLQAAKSELFAVMEELNRRAMNERIKLVEAKLGSAIITPEVL